MYIAIVQIPGAKRNKEDAIKGGLASTPTYAGLDGLISKHYLSGDSGGGGIYMWESKQKAEAWFNEDWWPWMEERFGVRPTLTCYDNYVVVDNTQGFVSVDGEAIEAAEA